MRPDERPEVVAEEVTAWVDQAAELLRIIQGLLEGQQQSNRPPSAGELAALLPLIRECRARKPSPETVRTWVKSIAEGQGG